MAQFPSSRPLAKWPADSGVLSAMAMYRQPCVAHVQIRAHKKSLGELLFFAAAVETEYNSARTFSRPPKEQVPPVET